MQRRVLSRAAEVAETGDWPPRSVGRMLAGLRRALDGQDQGEAVSLSRVRAELGGVAAQRVACRVLGELGVLVDDTVPAIRAWIDRRSDEMPPGYRDAVRAWLLELLEGGPRARPRSASTLYTYLGRVRSHLLSWSATRGHLREVTRDDVMTVLNTLRGHERAGVFTALRSLFGFAKRRRLIFVDPVGRVSVGAAPKRALVPMTDTELAAVKQTVVTPVQRLVVALVAVFALRAAAVRALTLDDVDLAARRIRLNGRVHRLPELVRQALVDWLAERHRIWPHTPNRHVVVSARSVAGTEPVTHYYLTWHLAMQGVRLEQIRGDRVLHEALAVSADPLHLAQAFGLSTQTAIDYSDIARSLVERPIETVVEAPSALSSSAPGAQT